eukprot:3476346-Rhodomonas_salina.3
MQARMQFTDRRILLWCVISLSVLAECSGFAPSPLFTNSGYLKHSDPHANTRRSRSIISGYPEGITYGTLPGVEGGTRAGGSGAGRLRQFSLPEPAPSRAELTGESRLFVDSADVNTWSLLDLGIFHGVTTNPVLLERAGKDCTVESLREMADSAFALGAREFMCQAWGKSALQMIDIGEQLASIDPRVVVKVPLTGPGVQAASVLARKGVRICCTGCYAPHQVKKAGSVLVHSWIA